jgi:hypothetical protein
MSSIRHLRKGLSVYKTGRSPFWMLRLRDPFEGRYVVRSTKEESRIEAIAAANEYADSFFKKANGDMARKKVTSFEYYADQMLAMQKPSAKTHDSDRKLLYRQKDGIIRHFGDYDVTKITTRMIREYLVQLDLTRGKPLADSTRSKHVIVIRKVLSLAAEDGLMKTIPVMPKQKTTDTPRHTFKDDEYKKFMKAAAECATRKDEVRGVELTGHHVRMFKFLVHSFLRPTKGELFGLRHKDIKVGTKPPHLEMAVHGGKTGKRISVTMPICVPLYKGMLTCLTFPAPTPHPASRSAMRATARFGVILGSLPQEITRMFSIHTCSFNVRWSHGPTRPVNTLLSSPLKLRITQQASRGIVLRSQRKPDR